MKKAIFFFAFTFVLGTFAANAQSCAGSANKSCCAGKISKAASADPSIEKRQSDDGSVAYVRKEADAQGNVKFVSVQFDKSSNTFVNVAPNASLVTDKTEMTKKTTSCSASEKKSCAGAGQGKACCANKAASCSEKKAEQ